MQGMTPYEMTNDDLPEVKLGRSSLPKILGVLHLIAAALGIWTQTHSFMTNNGLLDQINASMEKSGMAKLELSDEALHSMASAESVNQVFLYLGGVCTLVLLIAGVGLLKYRRWGRLFTHIYVGVALLTKASSVYLVSVAMTPIYEAMVHANEGLAVVGVDGLRAAAVVGVLFSCVYMLVSLILVNFKRLRHSLE